MITIVIVLLLAAVSAGPLFSRDTLHDDLDALYSVPLISSIDGEIIGAATILNSEWLLTSGFHGYLYNPDDVLISVSYGVVGTVEDIILHPKYKWNNWDCNLSMIKLRERMQLDDGFLKAVSWSPFNYESVRTAVTYKVEDEVLIPAEVEIIDRSICERMFAYNYQLKTICIRSSADTSDEVVPGSGLIHRGYLLGVFTNQFNDSSQNTQVYINTAEFQDWISDTILLRSRQGDNGDVNSHAAENNYDQLTKEGSKILIHEETKEIKKIVDHRKLDNANPDNNKNTDGRRNYVVAETAGSGMKNNMNDKRNDDDGDRDVEDNGENDNDSDKDTETDSMNNDKQNYNTPDTGSEVIKSNKQTADKVTDESVTQQHKEDKENIHLDTEGRKYDNENREGDGDGGNFNGEIEEVGAKNTDNDDDDHYEDAKVDDDYDDDDEVSNDNNINDADDVSGGEDEEVDKNEDKKEGEEKVEVQEEVEKEENNNEKKEEEKEQEEEEEVKEDEKEEVEEEEVEEEEEKEVEEE